MHQIQAQLLKLIETKDIGGLSLREIGELIGERLPQKVKHHLSQLESKGFIRIDKHNSQILKNSGVSKKGFLLTIPILGSANCGSASLYADQNIAGYLKISRRFISRNKGLFAVRAQGSSMNKANINGKSVDPGDFVIIDSTQRHPHHGDYILSVIDGLANIKKFYLDSVNKRIVLISESAQYMNPIFIHEEDDFAINGKVIDVIKKFDNF